MELQNPCKCENRCKNEADRHVSEMSRACHAVNFRIVKAAWYPAAKICKRAERKRCTKSGNSPGHSVTLRECARLRLQGRGKNQALIASKGGRRMGDGRPVIVRDDGGRGGAAIGITLIVIAAIAIALFAWHPWSISTNSTTHSTTSRGGK